MYTVQGDPKKRAPRALFVISPPSIRQSLLFWRTNKKKRLWTQLIVSRSSRNEYTASDMTIRRAHSRKCKTFSCISSKMKRHPRRAEFRTGWTTSRIVGQWRTSVHPVITVQAFQGAPENVQLSWADPFFIEEFDSWQRQSRRNDMLRSSKLPRVSWRPCTRRLWASFGSSKTKPSLTPQTWHKTG